MKNLFNLYELYAYFEKVRKSLYLSKHQFGINIGKGKNWWAQNIQHKRELKVSDIIKLLDYYQIDINEITK